MPFITEEIYHLLDQREDDICVKQLAAVEAVDPALLNSGKLLKEAVTAIRDARNKAHTETERRQSFCTYNRQKKRITCPDRSIAGKTGKCKSRSLYQPKAFRKYCCCNGQRQILY